MKYALCFRGISYYKDYYHADSPQLFDVDFSQSLGSFQKNIIKPLKETGNDVDIFFTTYDSVKLQDYIDIMKPKAVKLNSYQYLNPGIKNTNKQLFSDLTDNFYLDQSNRAFYSTANTRVSNDQGAFGEFLYGNMPSSKESNVGGAIQRVKDSYRYTLY